MVWKEDGDKVKRKEDEDKCQSARSRPGSCAAARANKAAWDKPHAPNIHLAGVAPSLSHAQNFSAAMEQLVAEVSGLRDQIANLTPRVGNIETSLSALHNAFIKTQTNEINYKLATGQTISGLHNIVQSLATHQLNFHGVTIPQQPSDNTFPAADAAGFPVPGASPVLTTQATSTHQTPAFVVPAVATPPSTAVVVTNEQATGGVAGVSRTTRSVGTPRSQ